MRALGAVGRRHQLHEVRLVGAGDEALGAVDDVVIAVLHRGGAHAAGIGAGVRLGLREGDLLLAAQHRHQVFLAQLALEREQDVAHRRAGDAFAARGQRDGARQLLGDDGALEQRQSGTAVFLRHLHHPDAEVLGALLQLAEEFRLDLLAFGGERLALDRDQLAVHEPPQRVLEHPQFFGKLELHHRSPRQFLCYLRRARSRARRRRPRPCPAGAPSAD